MTPDFPAAPASIPSLPTTRLCAECGTHVTIDESIVLNGVPVCAACKPAALGKLQAGLALGDAGVWRDKKVLVLGARSVLPDRCVKCNAPAGGNRLTRKLHWHSPAWYALILLNVIVYAVVAMAVRKRATIEVGICEKHRRARWIAILAGWSLFLGGIAAFVVLSASGPNTEWLSIVGVVLILAGVLWGLIGSRIVFAREIDTTWTRVGGAGRAFLESLPEFQKPAA